MNEKKCKILGYMPWNNKETHEELLRICISIKSDDDRYFGDKATYILLSYNSELENRIKGYINKEYNNAYYKTTDDIISGKTKVTEIVIN